MMLDADVVAASPSSVWRVLHRAGRVERPTGKPSNKRKVFHPFLLPAGCGNCVTFANHNGCLPGQHKAKKTPVGEDERRTGAGEKEKRLGGRN